MGSNYHYAVIICLLSGAVLCSSINVGFPQKPKRCLHEDSKCIANAISYLFNHRYQGDPSLNFPRVDPYRFPNINLTRVSNIVNWKCTLIANDLVGLRNINVHKVKGFGKDMTEVHEIYYTFKAASLVGDYEIDGTFLSKPIFGAGKHTNTMVNAEVAVVFTGKPYEKDGYIFMKADGLKIAVEGERYVFNFTNLYNGDEKRTYEMNAFLNDHWYILYQDLHLLYYVVFEQVFADMTNAVFSAFPYEYLFTESQY